MNILSYTPVPGRRMRTAVLISGGGRSLRNLLDRIADGRLTGVEIPLVISSSSKAGGLRFAEEAGIPTHVLLRGDFPTDEAYGDAVFAAIRAKRPPADGATGDAAGCDFVVLAGFLKRLTIPADFEHRVINIHPSLIPKFCGKGFYGHFVHEAVLTAGEKVSGCTVHFVDNEYDHGPIILQRSVPVASDDTPETLAARVFTAELDALPDAVQQIADGRLAPPG